MRGHPSWDSTDVKYPEQANSETERIGDSSGYRVSLQSDGIFWNFLKQKWRLHNIVSASINRVL
jgi:hypothetical protein